MSRRRFVLVVVVTFVAGSFFGGWCQRFVDIDRCLDLGGVWDYQRHRCDPDPNEAAKADCWERGFEWDYPKDKCSPRTRH